MRPSHRFDDLAEVELCSEFYSGYCRNGGICKITADIFHREIPVCSCMPGFRGKQCELVNDADMYYSGQLAQFERITLSTVVVSVMIIACVVSVSLYLYKRYINYGSNLSRNFTRSPTFICQVYPRRTGVWGGFLWRRQMQETSNGITVSDVPLQSEGSGRCVDAELLLAHSRNISTEEAVALRSEPHA
ncbi:hypothetical protein Tcan_13433 [Toxocara canis]|nr:hypothetical protein Tcan_13433 [Toxocara canis]